jgi:hypothetical protein
MEKNVASMAPSPAESPHRIPLWPAALLLVALAGVFLLVSDRSSAGPRWFVPAVLLALAVPLGLARRTGAQQVARALGLAVAAFVTAATASSVALLVTGLQTGRRSGDRLLADAALIWAANVLTFALWYWEVDGGGPGHRRTGPDAAPDFLFPRMTVEALGGLGWSPGLVDYLFLAFSTSTAFSPTDTLPLSGRAKLLMMAQALLSLVVLAVIAAYAINSLGSSPAGAG